MGEIAGESLRQGVLHIWMAWDHLAFLLCLSLLTSGRQFIGLITAFTIGHSITLTLVFYRLFNVPAPPVEIAIALSIAFMAREALHATGVMESRNALNRHLILVLLFGLLHGLGFGSALDESGVSRHLSSLIFFNLGIELGELLFVGLLTGILTSLRTISLAQPVRTAALYGAGVAGAFWVAQRAFDFGMA